MLLSHEKFFIDTWKDLPRDLAIEIFGWDLTFRDQQAIACVCKIWQDHVSLNRFGASYLQLHHLPQLDPNEHTWMPFYSFFLQNTPHIIALDCSTSMHEIHNVRISRDQIALANVALQCQKLAEVIAYRGIDCIAFGGSILSTHLSSADEIQQFFDKTLKDPLKPVGGNTNVNLLFEEIVIKQKKYLLGGACNSTRVTIISDFEDSNMDFTRLLPLEVPLDIECIRVGSGRGELDLGGLYTRYHTWQKIEEDNSNAITGEVTQSTRKSKRRQRKEIKEAQEHKQGLKRKLSMSISNAKIPEPPVKQRKIEDLNDQQGL